MKHLTLLQKLALISVGSAAAYKILLYQLGWTSHTSAIQHWPFGITVDIALVLRVLFAALGLAAFDLVLVSVVVDVRACRTRGVAFLPHLAASIVAAVVAAVVSGLMAVSTNGAELPWLAPAAALTMLAYIAHLAFLPVAVDQSLATVDQPQPAPAGSTTITINNANAVLPATVADFLLARADQLQTTNASQIAAATGTSVDTVRRAFQRSMTSQEDTE